MKRLLLAALVLAACTDAPPSAEVTRPTDEVTSAGAAGLALAVLPAGDVVAWVDTLKRLVVRPADGGEPVVVVDGGVSSHTQAGPRLAATSDGGLVVAYVVERPVDGRRFPASDLWVSRSDDGGRTWAAPVRPYPDAGIATGHTFHSLAAGADGTVVVAWLDGTARDRWRQDHPETADAGAHPPIRLVHDGEDHAAPTAEPGTQLVVAHSADGGRTFAGPATVADGTCQCCRTALAVAADGAVYAAWRHIFDGGERDMALARSDDGGATFGPPTKVHADGWAIDGCPHSGPAVTTDAEGAVHVAWSTGETARAGLWRAVSSDRGATFGEPVALAVPAPLGQVRAATVGGRAVFAVEDRGAVSVVTVGARDTVRVDGGAADLAAGPGGWRLLWTDGDRTRLSAPSPPSGALLP